jgi:hypothetical protein
MEHGLEAYQLHKSSVNSKRFLRIIPSLQRIDKKFALFGDNATWMNSIAAKNRYIKEGLDFVYNIKGQPELNPIEKMFLMIKTRFKRMKLQ